MSTAQMKTLMFTVLGVIAAEYVIRKTPVSQFLA